MCERTNLGWKPSEQFRYIEEWEDRGAIRITIIPVKVRSGVYEYGELCEREVVNDQRRVGDRS